MLLLTRDPLIIG